MFSLRRSMQALEEYVARDEPAAMGKWATDFDEHYRKLGVMVPEWRDELESEWSGRLRQAATAGDVEGVRHALGKLRTSCRSCHNEFQLQTRVLYRSADFSTLRVTDQATETLSYQELMQAMSRRVNQVKIFQEDGNQEETRAAAAALQRLLKLTATSCGQCHRDSGARDLIFSPQSSDYQSRLMRAVKTGDPKQVNSSLGNIGAFVCARCHSLHRPMAELRALLQKREHAVPTH